MSKVSDGFRPYDPNWSAGGFYVQSASQKMTQKIISASEYDPDGRSQWVYIRLPDGNLVLAVYPQGETYLATEADRQI